MNRIFSTLQRTDKSPAAYTETHYQFLDRVAGSFWDEIRDVLEMMFDEYPREHQQRLLTRLRGRSDEYWGAYWELALHSALLHLGLNPTVDPEIKIGAKVLTPDFRITDGAKSAIVEATVLNEPRQDRSADARQAPVLEMLSDLETRYHILHVVSVADASTAPSLKRLRGSMEAWIDDMETNAPTAPAPRHSRTFNEPGWSIALELVPRRPSRFGPRKGIGMGPARGRFVSDHADIASSLHKKAKRYSLVDEPLILACLNLRWTASSETWPLALFGVGWEHPEMIRDGRINPSWRNVPEGLWLTRKGVRDEHVSAVLAADNLGPWYLSSRTPVLWTNPWAHKPSTSFGVTQRTANTATGELSETAGGHLFRNALELDEDWPPGEPFPR